MAEYYDYTAYGTPTVYKAAGTDGNWFTTDDVVSTDGSRNPISALDNYHMFTGQTWETLTNQYYYKGRYYESTLGRFLSRDRLDPIDLGLNLFLAFSNEPINVIDPSGYLDISLDCSKANTKRHVTAFSGDRDFANQPDSLRKWRKDPRVFDLISAIQGIAMRDTHPDKELVTTTSQVNGQSVTQNAIRISPCTCVDKLTIVGHGSPIGLEVRGKLGKQTAEWHVDSTDLTKATAITPINVSVFAQTLSKYVCFCKPCEIWILSCNVGLEANPSDKVAEENKFARDMAAGTGCTVHVPMGYCYADGNAHAKGDQ